MDNQVTCTGGVVSVACDMTIYDAASLHAAMLAAFDGDERATALDLSQVKEFDTAGLQLLLFFRRHLASLGRELRITAVGSAAHEALTLCQLGGLLDLASAAPESAA